MPRKERINMFDGQIEMSFGQPDGGGRRRQQRQTRARWWFQRMRQIVDRATDWQPAPPPRPVQIWFPTAQDRFSASVSIQQSEGRNKVNEERQICE
jgi:hypothetical protein